METIILKIQETDISYDLNTLMFFDKCDTAIILKFFKSFYRNKQKYKDQFHDRFIQCLNLFNKDVSVNKNQLNRMLDNFDEIEKLSIKEIFEIPVDEIRRLFFSQINVAEMVAEFGSKRIDVKGKNVTRNVYDINGDVTSTKNYDVIYELHEVNGDTLNIIEKIYMVKCWCTSTNKEHFIWIESSYATDALTAIASTCRVEENILHYIKNIKRQGDVFIFELTELIEPIGEKKAVTAELFFEKLIAES